MKIIQSFWSKPVLNSSQNISQNRYNGGWKDYRYCLLSMAYSCLTIHKYYPHIELYTDSFGVELFKDVLKLPYNKFYTNLDDINNIDQTLWAYAKIMTYSLQKEPFLHVDNDIFIWSAFSEKLLQSDVVCQSLEVIEKLSQTDYQIAVDYIKHNIKSAPEIIVNSNCESAANMGIFGGCNIDFIQQYCKASKVFFSNTYNEMVRSGNLIGKFNVVFEQLMLTEMANTHNQEISYLISKNDIDEIVKYSTIETAQFEKKYTHCLGSLKKSIYICEQIEYRMRFEFPKYYNRIMSYINKEHIIYTDDKKTIREYKEFCKIHARISKATSISEVMNDFEFVLRPNYYIEEENDEYYLTSPHGKQKLTGWYVFLALFYRKSTGKTISREIIANEYLPHLTYTQIYKNIFYLIMEALYITKFLTIII